MSAEAPVQSSPNRPDRLRGGAPNPPASGAGWLDSALCTAGVWLLYVPHFMLLRALGPRWGLVWSRFVSRLHWLLTFIGVQKQTRENLDRLRQYFYTDSSVSSELRKHLEMKHECFARVRTFHQHGPEAGGLRWRLTPESTKAAERVSNNERGLLVVGFHFNFFEMTAPAFGQVLPSRKPVQVKLRQAHNLEHATTGVAEVAMNRAIEADRKSGAPIFYIDDEKSVRPLLRMLRSGRSVAVAADGTYSSDFIDAPFFDGTLRVSTGWARLAAMARARLIFVTDKPTDDPTSRELLINDALQCHDSSEASIQRVVTGAASLLEEAIKNDPWGWHPWQRLRSTIDDLGERRYELTRTRADHIDRAIYTTHAPTNNGEQRPRVAVLCNSVTPYRLHLHRRIAREVPEAELWTLTTHGNAYQRWSDTEMPAEIRPVSFGEGEPTNEQTMWRYTAREWRKGGDVIRWLRENGADAVFCQGCGDAGRLRVLRWCHENRVPVFLTGDFNNRGIPVPSWKRPLKSMIYRRAVSWSDALAPCGELGLDLLREYGGDEKPSYAFPFLPDTSLQSNPPLEAVNRIRSRFEFGEDRRRIVFSARMMPVKRPDVAIEAFAAVADQRPDWDLVMVGDGGLREASEALVPAPLRNRVIWTGFFDDPADVAAVYHLSDALLLPSDHEPWGVVIVEAAAAGLAIVATDVVGAAPELIQPGRNGETFPPGDTAALAETLLRVTTPDRIDAMKHESPQVLREWLDYADPVDNFRRALKDYGLIPRDAGSAPAERGHEVLEKSPV